MPKWWNYATIAAISPPVANSEKLGQHSPAFSRSSQHDPRNWKRPTSTHKASGWNRASALYQRRWSRVALAALAAEVPLELRPLRARDSIAQASGRPDG